uniref:NAC domain-containing protein n=1 Tax=Setaria italica TaxID=4555 RepID=K3YY98_SETIT
MAAAGLPPGILFAPEDEVAVGHYLLPRLLGWPLPVDGLVLDDDPLSAPPQELLERNGRKEEAFFFAEGQARCRKGTRQKRTCAGGGWWEGQKTCAEGDKLHVPGGGGEEAAWRKKALNFHCSGAGKKGSTGWVMHEYAVTAPEDLARSPLRLYHIRLSSYGRKQSGAMEVPRALGLPPGFLFAPEDGDVVAHYLLPRVLGQPLPMDGLILDDDPLTAPPWELLERNGRKEDAFFFALGQVKSGKGSRQKRTCAGGGFWNGERTCVDGEELRVPGLGGKEVVVAWRKKALSFQDGGAEKGSTGWVMHEYAITAPDHLAEPQLMLYRIRFSDHGRKRKRGEADPCAGEAAPAAARRRVAEDTLLHIDMLTSSSDPIPICSSTVLADEADVDCVNGAEHQAAPVTVSAGQDLIPGDIDTSWDMGFLENIDIDELLRSIEDPSSPNRAVLPAVTDTGAYVDADDSFFPVPNQFFAAC